MKDVDVIAQAFPKSPEGHPLCGHCGKRRPGYYMLCVDCWNALSGYVQMELLRKMTPIERAHLIVLTRPKVA